jgi:hypothetical protein
MSKITISARRCKGCGVVQTSPPPNGKCAKCAKKG